MTETSGKIPISDLKAIAEKYGLDQVILVARTIGKKGAEHVVTYGSNKMHCEVAADIGNFLKYKIMGWKRRNELE